MSSKPRVLVVEDDGEIAEVLRRSLRLDGYDVRLAGDGPEALQEAALYEPDAVVLDLGLPGRDGIDARVQGLDSGADDYLVKPFDREELLARLRAVLRRRPPRGSAFVVVGDLKLNPDTREVQRGD